VFFILNDTLSFPRVELAEEDGLLAVGGDLSPERLLLAYHSGIFPWYSDESPILWYAPHERFVVFPHKLKISKSMKQFLRSKKFKVTFDTAFSAVIKTCSKIKRKDQEDTWITQDMQEAYIRLHELGFAHSVEVWQENKLVGGLYGVLINKVFCGESMFSKVSNSSKIALIWLFNNLDINLVDCQVYTSHLESMGGEMISMKEYLRHLHHV